MKKKILSFLLAIAMVFTMIPLTAFATEHENETLTGNVYISISDDESFLTDKNHNPVAYMPVPLEELQCIELEDWGLGDYYYDENGDDIPEITALHLYIYVHENILGLDWSEVRFSGGAGSIFFEGGLFGYDDANLRYDVNGCYPAIDGWGLTADQIVLTDGDFVNIAHYTSWEFWGDDWSGFHYFTDESGNLEHTYNVMRGDELTLGLVRSYSDWNNGGAPAFAPRDYYYIYYGTAYGAPEGRITADENGEFDISFDTAGTWYLWADGGNGLQYGSTIVSAPAFATINVNDILFDIDLTKYNGLFASALMFGLDFENADNDFWDETSIASGKENKFYFSSEEYDSYIFEICTYENDESIIGWRVNGTDYLIEEAVPDNDYCWELENEVFIGYTFDVGEHSDQIAFWVDMGAESGYYTAGEWKIEPICGLTDTEKLDKTKAAEVEQKIADIGTVTAHKYNKIKKAREAYNALTENQKGYVENLSILNSAEKALEEAYKEAAKADHQSIYETTGKYINGLGTPNVGSTGGEWMVIALTRSGYDCPEGYYENVLEFVKNNINDKEQLHRSKSTENSRIILALTAAGYDVTDVGGHNLLMGLTDLNYVKTQGLNGPIWALIAFDSYQYDIPQTPSGATRNTVQVTRENLISYILDRQLADGGWALGGTVADADMTGMAIQALAPYYNTNGSVKEALDKAIICLSNMQLDNGGFGSVDGSSSESCAQVIVALTALGINPETDERFIKNGISVVDAMCLFALDEGGFEHIPGNGINGMATEQAQYALAAYFRFLDGKTALYDMSDVTLIKDKEAENENITDKIESPQTGDTSNITFYFTLMFTAWIVLTFIALYNKKFSKESKLTFEEKK